MNMIYEHKMKDDIDKFVVCIKTKEHSKIGRYKRGFVNRMKSIPPATLQKIKTTSADKF